MTVGNYWSQSHQATSGLRNAARSTISESHARASSRLMLPSFAFRGAGDILETRFHSISNWQVGGFDSLKAFRTDQNLWFRVAENTFDNFNFSMSAAGR
jgi:hypothetical protein